MRERTTGGDDPMLWTRSARRRRCPRWLRQAAGEPVGDIGRKVDVFERTFYRGKQVYGVKLPIGSQALKQ